jgi:tRNA-splicing ligase RtcB
MAIHTELPPHCRKVADCVFELDRDFRPGMQVPLRLIADEALLERWMGSRQLEQLIELAELPGATAQVVALPNLSEGDAPSGSAAAMRYPEGSLVPAAIGPDINCGLRLLTSPLGKDDLTPRLSTLLDELERAIPVRSERRGPLALLLPELDELLKEGCRYLVREKGVGTEDDLKTVPRDGHLHEAHGEDLSRSTRELGLHQLGTLGGGRSHFVEVGVVQEIYFPGAAEQLGLAENQVTVLMHASARALGERTYVETLAQCSEAMVLHHLRSLRPDLVYAPLDSIEGLRCLHALRAAANYGFANRHVLTHQARGAFERTYGGGSGAKLRVACDSPSNTIDLERIDGEIVCIHRRAATSAYGTEQREEVPRAYRELGEPVLLAGSMGSSSYVLLPTDGAAALSLASASHGAGRVMSRKQARKVFAAREIKDGLAQRGILARSPDLREEVPQAYRDAEAVLSVMERAGVTRRVARIRPYAVLKG